MFLDPNHAACSVIYVSRPKPLSLCILFVSCPPSLVGYVYLTFECEKSVKGLLMNCAHDPMDASQYYYKVCVEWSGVGGGEVCVCGCLTVLLQGVSTWSGVEWAGGEVCVCVDASQYYYKVCVGWSGRG